MNNKSNMSEDRKIQRIYRKGIGFGTVIREDINLGNPSAFGVLFDKRKWSGLYWFCPESIRKMLLK